MIIVTVILFLFILFVGGAANSATGPKTPISRLQVDEVVYESGPEARQQLRYLKQCWLIDKIVPLAKRSDKFRQIRPEARFKNFSTVTGKLPEINGRLLTNRDKNSSGILDLLNLSDEQLAHLVPHLRLYKIFSKGENQNELEYVPFPLPLNTKYDPSGTGLSSQGGNILDKFVGTGVGIKSFSYDLAGSNPAEVDKIIEANMVMSLTSLQDFFKKHKVRSSDNKERELQFADLIKYNPSERPGKRDPLINNDHILYISDFFRIKAEVGWSVPAGNPSFSDALIKQIEASRINLYLQLKDHTLQVDQDGSVIIEIDYIASMDARLNRDVLDVFWKPDDARLLSMLEGLAQKNWDLGVNSELLQAIATFADRLEKLRTSTASIETFIGAEAAAKLGVTGKTVVDLVGRIEVGLEEYSTATENQVDAYFAAQAVEIAIGVELQADKLNEDLPHSTLTSILVMMGYPPASVSTSWLNSAGFSSGQIGPSSAADPKAAEEFRDAVNKRLDKYGWKSDAHITYGAEWTDSRDIRELLKEEAAEIEKLRAMNADAVKKLIGEINFRRRTVLLGRFDSIVTRLFETGRMHKESVSPAELGIVGVGGAVAATPSAIQGRERRQRRPGSLKREEHPTTRDDLKELHEDIAVATKAYKEATEDGAAAEFAFDSDKNKKIPAGYQPVLYFYFGDLIDVAIEVVTSKKHPSEKTIRKILKDIGIMIGPIDVRVGNKNHIMNMAHVPISLDYFLLWFQNNVINADRPSFPLKDFILSIANKMLTSALSDGCVNNVQQSININMATFNKPKDSQPARAGARCRISNLKFSRQNLGNKDNNRFLYLYSREDAPQYYNGDESEDKDLGIYHIKVGHNRGLLKKITFSKIDLPGLKESRIAGDANAGEFIREKYSVTMDMVGNTLFAPGQYVYVNPYLPGASSQETENVGLGGYHFVHGVTHTIESGHYHTRIMAHWQTFKVPTDGINTYPKRTKIITEVQDYPGPGDDCLSDSSSNAHDDGTDWLDPNNELSSIEDRAANADKVAVARGDAYDAARELGTEFFNFFE